MQYLLELFCRESLNSIYHFTHLLVIKLNHIFCSWVNFFISSIIDQVATNWGIILNFYRNFSPCFLVYNFKLLLLNKFCFFNISFLYTVMISVNLLQFFLMKSLLQHLGFLFLKLSLFTLKLEHLWYVHVSIYF